LLSFWLNSDASVGSEAASWQLAYRDTFALKKIPQVLGGSRREFQSPALERPVVKETVPPGQINQLSDPDLPGRINNRWARLRNLGHRAFFGRFGLLDKLGTMYQLWYILER
jgi:hypothetical protein